MFLELFKRRVARLDKTVINLIRRFSVKKRFLLMGLIISIVPILVIGVVSVIKADADIVSKVSTYSLQLVKQLGTNINSKFVSWEQYGDIIAVSKDTQEILAKYDEADIDSQYMYNRKLLNTMSETIKASLDIQETDIITNNNNILCPNTRFSAFVSNLEVEVDSIKKMSDEAKGSYVWYTGDIKNHGYIILSRSIKDINTFQRYLGYLMIQIDGSFLLDLYKNVNLGNGSRVYIVDSNYMTVLSENKSEIGTYFSPEIARKIQEQYNKNIYDSSIKNAENKYFTVFSRIPESGWTIIALIPNAYLNSLSNDIRNLMIGVMIIALIVSLLIFTIIYKSITSPLNQLISSMREVKKGNLEWRKVDEEVKDEVGEVTQSYNKMISDLNIHIENIKETEKKKAMAEFRALQAQINPHFIANTLNNVAWMAKMQKAENIETVVTSLIQLLNTSMGRGADLIPIEQELLNIKSYVNIQEFKYYKKIDVYYDIDEELNNYKILRFVLQPIVENAIIHGIGPLQAQGIISIKGYMDAEDIIFVITDTGVGMDQEEVWNLLNGEKQSNERFSSIGIRNVNERIKVSYGDRFGLLINSQKNIFTSVEVKLPKIQ